MAPTYKRYIRRIILADWSTVKPTEISQVSNHYSDALEWLSINNIYTSDLTMEGLMGMVASHTILFENISDVVAFTLVYGDLIQ